jgi:hypothetical protein
MEDKEYRFAVLIDGDNASYKTIGKILDQVRILGRIIIKRVYGDFSTSGLSPWRKASNELALTPVQQFAFTAGKNSTDSRMVIDAMDLLHGGTVNAFCIVSSDCDFTGLAKRLKESDMFIFGAGKAQTPASFVSSCDRFLKVDEEKESTEEKPVPKAEPAEKQGAKTLVPKDPLQKVTAQAPVCGDTVDISEKDVVSFARDAMNAADGQSLRLSKLMHVIYRKFPSFDPKDYGCKKAVDFFRKQECFSVAGELGTVAISAK